MLQRFASLASLICICIVGFIISVACQASEQGRFELSTSSPTGTYQVHCKEVDIQDAEHHEVRFDVFKGRSPLIQKEVLYEGGRYDDKFSKLFPEHSWPSASVLRFGRKDRLPEYQHDEVTVANETDRTVAYLRLNAGKYEAFLVFELLPKSSVTLNVQPQTDDGRDASYIGCKGRLDNGNPIAESAGNFRVRGKYRGRAHYAVNITDQGVSIKSKEFELLP